MVIDHGFNSFTLKFKCPTRCDLIPEAVRNRLEARLRGDWADSVPSPRPAERPPSRNPRLSQTIVLQSEIPSSAQELAALYCVSPSAADRVLPISSESLHPQMDDNQALDLTLPLPEDFELNTDLFDTPTDAFDLTRPLDDGCPMDLQFDLDAGPSADVVPTPPTGLAPTAIAAVTQLKRRRPARVTPTESARKRFQFQKIEDPTLPLPALGPVKFVDPVKPKPYAMGRLKDGSDVIVYSEDERKMYEKTIGVLLSPFFPVDEPQAPPIFPTVVAPSHPIPKPATFKVRIRDSQILKATRE